MDDQKLIEQLQDALDRHEHDTQELKRENEELRQSVNDLLQKEKKSEELRQRLGELLSAGGSDAELKQRLRSLLGDFEKCAKPPCLIIGTCRNTLALCNPNIRNDGLKISGSQFAPTYNK